MTPQEILEELTHAEDLPEAALREASARRAELTEPFLEELERWLADSEADPEEPSSAFFLAHLLGSWREPRAYRLLCRIMRTDPERLEAHFGDALTMTLPRMVATLYDGDFQPMNAVIEDDAADEFARGVLVEAIGALVRQGKVPREEALRYLSDLPARLAAPIGHDLWVAWAAVVADLRAVELQAQVEAAFNQGFVEREAMSLEEFRRDVGAEPNGDEPEWAKPFGEDVVAELTSIFAFGDAEEEEAPPEVPYVNPYRHVGRNDPCPCGSGKKFKRCCGA